MSGVPQIAVVGRQNVGKSTLVNRLFGKRAAIAHDAPGVTRDRIELEATWRGRRFGLVDTAGYLHRATGLEALAAEQAERSMKAADLIVLVVDVHAGITQEDGELARRLRTSPTSVLLVANKADSPGDDADIADLYRLGLGEPFPVSALHGQGIGDLMDRMLDLLPDAPEAAETPDEPRFAIVGRPNVGKSTMFNRLVGENRSVVSEVSGTTRDSVDSLVAWPEHGTVRFIDTAGMRKGTKVRGVEYYSVLRARHAIEAAHVAVVVLDASDGFSGEDKKIANLVMDAGRALILAANKWDLVEDKDRWFKRLEDEVQLYARATVLRTSATRGQGVHRLGPLLLDLHARWSSRASTSSVNDIVQTAQRERPTPKGTGTLHYATQVATAPPSFVIFGGARPPEPTYQRYIENRLRRDLHLNGVPIRLRFRPRTRDRR
ncbi:MAG TPA: ribosome biogenesis GTPase Der [Actinomycetota bacterium]|nr:ribosome biogenesis GTPase Der [Actinomycetota bacterium]